MKILLKFLKYLQWAYEYVAYRIAEFVFSFLSPEQVFTIGEYLGRFTHRIYRYRRLVVTHNLRIAFGDKLSREEIKKLTLDIFARSGANLIAALRTAELEDEELKQRMHFPNFEEYLRLYRDGNGVILLLPHMGNWEMLAQATRLLPPGTVQASHYQKLKNPLINRRVEAQRAQDGTLLLSKKISPHVISGILRKGGGIGILGDQRAGKAGYWAQYYGQFASCTPLPEALSRRTGAEVALMYVKTTKHAHWEVVVETLKDVSTPALMASLKEATLSSVEDVFWFQDRWQAERRNPFGINAKPHPDLPIDTPEKPFRLLVFLSSPDEPLPKLPNEVRPNLQLEVAHPIGSTPPNFPGMEWHKTWTYDDSIPKEHLERILEDIDESEIYPLAGIVVTKPSREIQRICPRIGTVYCHVKPAS